MSAGEGCGRRCRSKCWCDDGRQANGPEYREVAVSSSRTVAGGVAPLAVQVDPRLHGLWPRVQRRLLSVCYRASSLWSGPRELRRSSTRPDPLRRVRNRMHHWANVYRRALCALNVLTVWLSWGRCWGWRRARRQFPSRSATLRPCDPSPTDPVVALAAKALIVCRVRVDTSAKISSSFPCRCRRNPSLV